MNRRLLNKQRSQIHDLLLQANLDPALSKWTDDKKGWTNEPVETLEVGLCYFLFSPDYQNQLSIKCRPAPDGGTEWGTVNLSWDETLHYFSMWANHAKEELESVDPWSRYATFFPPDQSAFASDAENKPFTHSEAEVAVAALESLIIFLESDIPGYDTVSATFNTRFRRLGHAAKSGAGRVDWSNQFVGLLISLCIALSLMPDQAAMIWNTWTRLISRLIGS